MFPEIEAKHIAGYRSIELLRRDREEELEFLTVMIFDSLQNVVDFRGGNYRRSYVPAAAQQVLRRWDRMADDCEVREVRRYGSPPSAEKISGRALAIALGFSPPRVGIPL